MQFSKNKFSSLSPKRQYKKILDFISEIEKNWEKHALRTSEIENLKDILKIMNEETFSKAALSLHPEINHRDFLKAIVPVEQYLLNDKRDNDIIINKLDGNRQNISELDLILVLSNLRSAFNVGSILRTAECFGIKELYFCGYTPDNHKVAKTAMGTREFLTVTHFEDTASAIATLKSQNRFIYALETAENAHSIYNNTFTLPAALIVGNEALGISSEILKQADKIIQIPLAGWKNSLNVGVATAITVSEIFRR